MRIDLIAVRAEFLIDENVNPPLGLGYLSSYLKNNKHEEVYIHHIITGQKTPRIKSDLIGISFTASQFYEAIRIMNELREVGNDLFVAGGIHPTVNPNECLNSGFDYVVVGEGEKSLLKLVNSLEKKEKIERIIISEQIDDIDTVPFPDYDALNIKDYVYKFNNREATIMFTSRGCPYNCNFCSSGKMFPKVRFHSINYIKKHIDLLHDKYGFGTIMFMDDVFTLSKSRLLMIGNYLKEKGMGYRCLSRANLLTEEIIGILKNTGCLEVGIGIESGNQKMLDVMNKRTTVEQNYKAILNCKDAGINVKVFTLIGVPGETKETIFDTIKLLEETKPHDVDSNVLVPYPGTNFFDNIDKYDLTFETTDYSKAFTKGKINDYEPVIRTSNLTSSELNEYKWKIFNKFSKLVKKKNDNN